MFACPPVGLAYMYCPAGRVKPDGSGRGHYVQATFVDNDGNAWQSWPWMLKVCGRQLLRFLSAYCRPGMGRSRARTRGGKAVQAQRALGAVEDLRHALSVMGTMAEGHLLAWQARSGRHSTDVRSFTQCRLEAQSHGSPQAPRGGDLRACFFCFDCAARAAVRQPPVLKIHPGIAKAGGDPKTSGSGVFKYTESMCRQRRAHQQQRECWAYTGRRKEYSGALRIYTRLTALRFLCG